jgi:hypothetical protein
VVHSNSRTLTQKRHTRVASLGVEMELQLKAETSPGNGSRKGAQGRQWQRGRKTQMDGVHQKLRSYEAGIRLPLSPSDPVHLHQ